MTNNHPPIALIILDGWGYRSDSQYNAIAAANTPHWDNLLQTCPHDLIAVSGLHVGLPDGQMGNSEVGHLNMGAGRVVFQDYTRIEQAIADGSFDHNEVLVAALNKATNNNRACHILGLLSTGGVHSHQDQLFALAKLAANKGIKQLYLHAFLDGRDTPPQSAMAAISAAEDLFATLKTGKIAAIIGRYYAMDRDKRWDRIQSAYALIAEGKAEFHALSAIEALEHAYARGETDEFVKATSIHPPNDQPIHIEDGDVVIFMNYRADRARELTHALTDADFNYFPRPHAINFGDFVTLTQYATNIRAHVAFPPIQLNNILGEYLANHGVKQLRLAETEKYAHVTFFFNGGIETPFSGEERILIPSAKVATYDLQPEMSALEITDALVDAIKSRDYGFIVVNYANPDMVGHTGNFPAAIKAIETIDECLGKIISALNNFGGEAIITADHGNAELMFDKATKQPHTAHTYDPVPLVYFGRAARMTKELGSLSDIAPTILYLMNLPKPAEMTGQTLLTLE